MKIPESTPVNIPGVLPGAVRRAVTHRSESPADFQNLSMPSILALTEVTHPDREMFLSALSQSLKDGLYSCEPDQVADAILTRGFSVSPAEEG